ncbi:hypothetical protein CLOM_g11998 [Closterium sp. NIES-68]|nr:hypothetical protein CLOM_g11998 [Closterium sp. NIES-68]GJP84581.1 hypothetical protein CLOP_g14639 [Closterium sp. NIES-67]
MMDSKLVRRFSFSPSKKGPSTPNSTSKRKVGLAGSKLPLPGFASPVAPEDEATSSGTSHESASRHTTGTPNLLSAFRPSRQPTSHAPAPTPPLGSQSGLKPIMVRASSPGPSSNGARGGAMPAPRVHAQPPPRQVSFAPSTRSHPMLVPEMALVPNPLENENVLVTVRFRPLSLREIQRGEDVGWYADGDKIVRMESNPAIAYAYDKVFGPATTTRGVYDVAAQPVVSAAMEGINGTVFAYGVTSSGKTHSMHGDQKSPGVIPLAVKEVFSIIQDTPGREFLLRVSYLEIYNEVINDLLNPAGQNLRIREDGQHGTFVENVKEEVVLSAAHALSLIAAGEEHRHVGATHFNTASSRSHTIFTLTVESSGRDLDGYEEVTYSQLNLIDLAGSENSRATTGNNVRRREGTFINKSLLTLGTVISKLSERKQSHVPYRDSKLTRLLQTSLSGNARISLICTVTPASGTLEETHNTLKFASRAKHVEIRANANKILDEKSLIKKYQKEILALKDELTRLKQGITHAHPDLPWGAAPASGGGGADMGGQDLAVLREKLEADQMLLQSRLEEEEEAKAALLTRIQRLTKLILVSSKASSASKPPPAQHAPPTGRLRRRLSFGEEDLAYLKQRRMDLGFDLFDDAMGGGGAGGGAGDDLQRLGGTLGAAGSRSMSMHSGGSGSASGAASPRGTGTGAGGGGDDDGGPMILKWLRSKKDGGGSKDSEGDSGLHSSLSGSENVDPLFAAPGTDGPMEGRTGSDGGQWLTRVSSGSGSSEEQAGGGPKMMRAVRRTASLLSVDEAGAGMGMGMGGGGRCVETVRASTQAGELFHITGVRIPSSGTTLMDQCELLREQVKILSAEVGFHTSNLRRLIDKGENTPQEQQEIERLRVELAGKQQQLREMEELMRHRQADHHPPAASSVGPNDGAGMGAEAGMGTQEQMAKTIAKLKAVLSEKTFDMEIVSADNRILQDSLKAKTRQVQQLMEEANMLRVELTRAITSRNGAARGQGDEAGEGGDGGSTEPGSGGSGGGGVGEGSSEGQVLVAVGELEDLRSQVKMAREEAAMLRQQQQQLTKDLAGARSLAVMTTSSTPNAPSSAAAAGTNGADGAAAATSLSSYLDGAYMNGPDGRGDVSELLRQVEAARAREAQWAEHMQQHHLVEAELAAARAELAAFRTAAAAEAGGTEGGEGGESEEGGGEGVRKQEARAVGAVAARLEAEKDALLAVREREVGELQASLAAAQQREAALERDLGTMWVLVAELRDMGGGSRASSVKDSQASGKEGGGGMGGAGSFLDAEEMAELAGSIGGSGRWLGELRKGESVRSEGGSEGSSEGGLSLSERAMELIRGGSGGGVGVRGGEMAQGQVETRVQVAVERETAGLKDELARRKGENLAGLTLRELMALEADMETALTKLEVAKMRVRAGGSTAGSTGTTEIDPTARTAPEMLTCAPCV